MCRGGWCFQTICDIVSSGLFRIIVLFRGLATLKREKRSQTFITSMAHFIHISFCRFSIIQVFRAKNNRNPRVINICCVDNSWARKKIFCPFFEGSWTAYVTERRPAASSRLVRFMSSSNFYSIPANAALGIESRKRHVAFKIFEGLKLSHQYIIAVLARCTFISRRNSNIQNPFWFHIVRRLYEYSWTRDGPRQ